MCFQKQVCVEGHESPQNPAVRERPWHVLHVRSNCEKRVAQHLAVRSVEHYVPLYQERVKWTDRSVITERPLFPGYVFARFLAPSRIAVISAPGVVRSLGDEPGNLVSGAELDRIREGLESGLSLRPHAYVSVGTRVRVRSGVFAGVEGIVAQLRQQCRVVISVAAVQQCFSLEAAFDDLEILSPVPASTVQPAAANGYWRLQTARP